jgi:molybdopterin molybdotransferase
MRTTEEHLAAALALVEPLPEIEVALDDALGCVLTRPLLAPDPLPRWDNSSMDGYAVRAGDTAGASVGMPRVLRVLADLAAGSAEDPEVVPGTTARIMTGAPLPQGADAVVPVESTDGGVVVVRVHAAAAPGDFVRRVGEDAHAGDVVLAEGAQLNAQQIGAAAGIGAGRVHVRPRPRVAVLATGSELVAPGSPLRRGQIPDSNSHLLTAAVREAGGVPVPLATVPDDPAVFRTVLAGLRGRVDAVVTSGGVSMGAFDVVKEALRDEPGMEFVAVAMQPGRPQGLGTLADGTPVFCLPGNPVSVFVSFEVFVRPAILRMRGFRSVRRPRLTAVVVDGWRSPPGRAQYMPVVLERADDARADDGWFVPAWFGDGWTVRQVARGGSGSHLVASLGGAQALAVVPADVVEVAPGDAVPVMLVNR